MCTMARKPKGTGHGGKRPGAGRPPGAKNKRTVLAELLPKLTEPDRQLPLYRLLDRIADENLDPKYRDVLSIACLPYLHARVPATLTAKPPFLMTDEELQETRRAEVEHQRQVALGRGHLHLIPGPK
jgi:hypothetical protein